MGQERPAVETGARGRHGRGLGRSDAGRLWLGQPGLGDCLGLGLDDRRRLGHNRLGHNRLGHNRRVERRLAGVRRLVHHRGRR
ncbi:MAG: hypothetical protein ACRD0H_02100, partial [Actinomycetes bacterium]